nr:hypothetical protein [uncultured Campylobacter sp.]
MDKRCAQNTSKCSFGNSLRAYLRGLFLDCVLNKAITFKARLMDIKIAMKMCSFINFTDFLAPFTACDFANFYLLSPKNTLFASRLLPAYYKTQNFAHEWRSAPYAPLYKQAISTKKSCLTLKITLAMMLALMMRQMREF